jgi:guanyl-specific ribonuclease Sa
MRRFAIPVLVLLIAAATLWQRDGGVSQPDPVQNDARPAETRGGLPAEAWATLALIERGGPFPYRQDGGVFQNREGLLPPKSRGYYREYTVPTPGARDRGARRFVTGGTPPDAWYYTDDHYRSFRSISPEDRPAP